MSKTILVTGGNSGIGFALCRQLVAERDCRVFLGARSAEKGRAAVEKIQSSLGGEDGSGTLSAKASNVEFVQIDVSSDESVASAASAVEAKLGDRGHRSLYAVVNNAGTGLKHGVGPEDVLNTNLHGPRRVCEAFLPLLCSKMGRIVNVGSGSGPSYVRNVEDKSTKKMLCGFGPKPMTWDWIELHAKAALGSDADSAGGYGLSKALLACYTMFLAKEHPHVTSSCVTPGFIDTNLTRGYGATKTPEEGTVSIHHCLFDKLDGNGWYYGSDGLRSPLHYMRNPGEPPYDGTNPLDD